MAGHIINLCCLQKNTKLPEFNNKGKECQVFSNQKKSAFITLILVSIKFMMKSIEQNDVEYKRQNIERHFMYLYMQLW